MRGILKTLTLIIFLSIIFSIGSTKEDSYAIEKPTYSDMIKNRYDNKISDKEAKSIATEESTMKETYTKGIKTLASMELTKDNSIAYGAYPSSYLGAVNYRRENFKVLTYFLRDISKNVGKQPIMAAKISDNSYDHMGLNPNFKKSGLTSKNTISWMLKQFEVNKLLGVYEDSDYLILKAISEGKYEDIFENSKNLKELIKITTNNDLDSLDSGDLLISYDQEEKKINYIGIYLGKDEQDNPYSLSPNKLVYNSRDYAMNVWALSYINSSNVYIQEVNNTINLVSGTKYNYGLRMKFLK